MVSIVLASHGDLAAGIKQTGSMALAISRLLPWSRSSRAWAPTTSVPRSRKQSLPSRTEEQVLFLVDLGRHAVQPDQRAHRGHDSWAIVTGVNLPMLIGIFAAL